MMPRRAEELRANCEKLAEDEGRAARASGKSNGQRLRAAGYNQDYFEAVRAALRRLLGRIEGGRQPERRARRAAATET